MSRLGSGTAREVDSKLASVVSSMTGASLADGDSGASEEAMAVVARSATMQKMRGCLIRSNISNRGEGI